MRGAINARHDPRCRVWAVATASLWGIADDHDLDEPVQLTEAAPVRVGFNGLRIITDRVLSLEVVRAGHHAMLRLYFRPDKFHEIDVSGVTAVLSSDKTVEVTTS
jgi:hypothetical protein